MLTKILFDKFWKRKVGFESTSEGYIERISGTVAGLIIGDRAFDYRDRFPYSYDLSEEWFKFTGLPFVFACWVSRIPLDPKFELQFCKAMSLGFSKMEKVVEEYSNTNISGPHLRSYLNKDISYNFDADKRKAMALFLSHCKNFNNE
jgi:chorismate dehydratase